MQFFVKYTIIFFREDGLSLLVSIIVALFLQFVAHPICQQVLSSIWCGNLAGWRGSRTAWKLFVSMGIFLTMPFLCLVYWIAPKSKVLAHFPLIGK